MHVYLRWKKPRGGIERRPGKHARNGRAMDTGLRRATRSARLDRRSPRPTASAITTAVVILWLAIIGGYEGWKSPVCVIMASVGGIYVTGRFVWGILDHGRRPPVAPRLSRFGLASLTILVATLVSLLMHPATWSTGLWRLIVIFGYTIAGYYAADLGEETIVHGSILAGWILLPLIILASVTGHLWENRNIIAAFPVILAPIGLIGAGGLPRSSQIGESGGPNLGPPVDVGDHPERPKLLWLALAIVAEISTGSLGGMLALAVTLLVTWHISPVRLTPAGLALAVVAVATRPTSMAWRLEYWRVALDALLSSPLAGIGPGMFYSLWPPGREWYHAHNIIMTTAAETGLIGLAALGFAAWQLWRLLGPPGGPAAASSRPNWQTAIIIGLLAHSLVDEPLQFWGPGAAFVVAVVTLERSIYDHQLLFQHQQGDLPRLPEAH